MSPLQGGEAFILIKHYTIGHGNLLFNLILVPVACDFLAASIISNTCNACSALMRGSIPFTRDSPILVAPSCHSYPPLSVLTNFGGSSHDVSITTPLVSQS